MKGFSHEICVREQMEKLELPSLEIVMKGPQRSLAKLDQLEIICEES